MFRNTAAAEPAPDVDVMTPAEVPVPISVLALDLPEPSGGWVAYLAGRDIPVVVDDVGRDSISRDNVRMLIAEKREGEARAREVMARQEREAVERDQQWRAQLSGGIPWWELPPGVTAAEVWAQSEKDSRPKRRSMLEEALAGEGMTFHPIGPEGNES